MKKTTAKKFFAALMCAALLLCSLAGCDDTPAGQPGGTTSGTGADSTTGNNTQTNSFVLAAKAALYISYDAEGMVLDILPMNDACIPLSEICNNYQGKPCADAAKDIMAFSAKEGLLGSDVKSIVIKHVDGSQLPDPNFLQNIASEVETAARTAHSDASVVLVEQHRLNKYGYLDLGIVKRLLLNHLGAEEFDQFYGGTRIYSDNYIVTVEVGGEGSSYRIDGLTGIIEPATEDDLLGNGEYISLVDEHLEFESIPYDDYEEPSPEDSGILPIRPGNTEESAGTP